MSRWILTSAQLVQEAPLELVGGKAAGLARLARLAVPVPDFAVLTTRAWSDCHGGTGEIPVALRKELVESWQVLGGGALAVRSSGVAEDGAAASWAGQYESFLGVQGVEALVRAVRSCWASARSERVLAYARTHGLEVGPVAVVLQRMVEGQVSGVLFSRDPQHPDYALISAGLGLGEGVVQGRVPCDTFRVDEERVHAELADKDEEVVLVDGAPTPRAVSDERRHAPSLADEQLQRLFRLGRRLEQDVGVPVDVEFTEDQGRLLLLQVRPITVPIPQGRRLLWDNSNIVESYSGLTTPLTFSFASRAYTIVYQLFCRVMGVSDEVIRANEPTFRRMIGLVRGRIYYNLNSWYRVLSLLPGFSFNRAAMETMMGVSEVASDEDAGAGQGRLVEGISLARLILRLGWRLFTLESDAARFRGTFKRALAQARARDLDTLRPDELLAAYEAAERDLLWAWTPPLVNDFFTMIFYKLLQSTCQKITRDPTTQLHNRLLAGQGELASAAPAAELVSLAELARDADRIHRWLISDEPDEVVLGEVMEHDGFRGAFERWLDRWGDRSPDELKLESPTLRDTPEFVLQTLRGWLRRGELPRLGQAEKLVRAEAEADWRRHVPLRKRILYGWILRQARRRVALRELLRLERTRVFGFVRDLFRAFGDRYVQGGALDQRDDVFFLTLDEVLGYTRGTTASTDLRGLVALRRAEQQRWAQQPAPAERFHTWGAVHLHNPMRGQPDVEPLPTGDDLVGTPCSPGVVRAPARVVRDPREHPDLGGALLVAHRTDPGWVPLFPTASGVLVERGSLLSHSAVVARELGKPAIVGLRGLLDWVEDGEELEMDGAAGTVRRVGHEDG